MSVVEPVRITGIRQFVRQLKQMDQELPKEMRVANNAVAQLIVDRVKPWIPARRGRARKSLRARSTRTAARVSGGRKSTAYYGWLDFGGSTGIRRSVRRPFLEEGRYIYPGFSASRDEIGEAMTNAIMVVARKAGLEVSESG